MPFQLLRQMLRQLPGQLEDQRFQPEQLPPASRRGRRLAAAPPQLLIQPMPRTAARLPEYVASGQQFKLEVQRIERQLRAEIEFEVESGRHEIPVPRLQGEPLIPGMVDQFTRSGRDQENPVEAVAVPPAPAEFGLAELRDPAIQLPGQRRQRVVSRHSHESICFRTVIEFEESSDVKKELSLDELKANLSKMLSDASPIKKNAAKNAVEEAGLSTRFRSMTDIEELKKVAAIMEKELA